MNSAHCSRCVCECVSTASGVCALGWVKCREHISLLVILCIIVYVTNLKNNNNTNIGYRFFFKTDIRLW